MPRPLQRHRTWAPPILFGTRIACRWVGHGFGRGWHRSADCSRCPTPKRQGARRNHRNNCVYNQLQSLQRAASLCDNDDGSDQCPKKIAKSPLACDDSVGYDGVLLYQAFMRHSRTPGYGWSLSGQGRLEYAVIKVKPRGNESVQQMLKRFKRLCQREGLTREIKRNSYYEKPSERKRRESRKAARKVEKGPEERGRRN